MNLRKLARDAARWAALRRGEVPLGTWQRRRLKWWLRRSKWHVKAFREALRAQAKRRQREPLEPAFVPRDNVIPLFDRMRRGESSTTAVVCALAPPEPFRISRRGLLAAMASGVAVALTIVRDSTSDDVIDSGHVRQVRLRDGIMHVARHAVFRLQAEAHAQTVHLSRGQAAFHLWAGAPGFTVVQTPLCEIFVAAARFSLVALESLVELTVMEGVVRVALPAHASSPAIMVSAGEQVTFRPGLFRPDPTAVSNVERRFAWTRGELFFEGESIAEAASIFNRFNQLQIEPSPEIAHLSVSKHRCALNDPRSFVDRFVGERGLASRTAGGVIYIFK